MKKHIKFKDSSQVWRILISPNDNLIVETRDTAKKEAFFSCYNLNSGKKLFKNFQMDEKYWLGIEELYEDLILFHRFVKPDMPGHKSIIAFDINSREVVWENNEYSFLFLYDQKIYCFNQQFEGRTFYTVDPNNGNLLEDLGNDALAINELKYKADDEKDYSSYFFPNVYDESDSNVNNLSDIIEKHLGSVDISGKIEYVKFGNIVFMNFHHNVANEILENKFIVYDITKDKITFSEILNSATNNYVPDSFFIYKNFVIVLKEKNEVIVYKLDS